MLLLLKIFVRLFGMITFLYLINFSAKANFHQLDDLYISISSIFYLMFFVFLDSIIKVSAKFSLSEKLIKPLNILKWIPLIATFYLIYLKIEINKIELSAVNLSTPAFLFTKIWPIVAIPNLSFIIITILIFYTSAILNRNKKLKEENDLTI
jgi:hypothetical protein